MRPTIALPKFTRSQRLMIIIGISFSFFLAEIGGKQVLPDEKPRSCRLMLDFCHSVGFTTRSLALIADAFHYVCDMLCHIEICTVEVSDLFFVS